MFFVLVLILVVVGIITMIGKNQEKNAFMNECMASKTYEQCEQDFIMKKTENSTPSNMQVLEQQDIFENTQSTPGGINGLDSLQ